MWKLDISERLFLTSRGCEMHNNTLKTVLGVCSSCDDFIWNVLRSWKRGECKPINSSGEWDCVVIIPLYLMKVSSSQAMNKSLIYTHYNAVLVMSSEAYFCLYKDLTSFTFWLNCFKIIRSLKSNNYGPVGAVCPLCECSNISGTGILMIIFTFKEINFFLVSEKSTSVTNWLKLVGKVLTKCAFSVVL